jgi:hypothetical protein
VTIGCSRGFPGSGYGPDRADVAIAVIVGCTTVGGAHISETSLGKVTCSLQIKLIPARDTRNCGIVFDRDVTSATVNVGKDDGAEMKKGK